MKTSTKVLSGTTIAAIGLASSQQCAQEIPTIHPALVIVADICIPDTNLSRCEEGELILVWTSVTPGGKEVELKAHVSPGENYKIGREILNVDDTKIWLECLSTGLKSEPAYLPPSRLEGLLSCKGGSGA